MTRLTLITEQMLARVPGGTGRYSHEVAVAVTRSVRPGWSVDTVTAWHRRLAAARVAGVSGPCRLPAGAKVLARLWERGLPPTVPGDVVHALTPLAPPRLRRNQSLVVSVHDAVPFTHPDTLTPHGARWHRRMIAQASKTAAALIVPTRAVADQLARAGVRARVEVIGEGVAADLLQAPDPAAIARARAMYQLPERYLVTVGTMEPRKGLDVLLAALSGPGAPGLAWAAIGQTGWGHTDLAYHAVERGISDRVHVLGRIPDAEMAAVVKGAVAAVVPSRSEGFGLPVLEAMSLGVPVVHSDAPALVEVAGGAGEIAAVGDPVALRAALKRVIDHPQRQAAMVLAGRERAAAFSWASVAEQLWDLYSDVAPVTTSPD